MAIVIDALDFVRNNKKLPCEAFFVDTNIVIYHRDPFSLSATNKYNSEMNSKAAEVVHNLRSQHYLCFSTISVIVEYYKYIQVNSYTAYQGNTVFESHKFKELKLNDPIFKQTWELRLRQFTKFFTKHFPIIDETKISNKILSDFDGTKVDFGDHALYHSVMNFKPTWHCILTNDKDFYSYSDELFILTFNDRLIMRATLEGKLHK